MKIRHYAASDSREIADLFHDAIHAISPGVYSPGQLEAWAPTPPDYESWAARLERSRPFVAMIDNCIVGFIELQADGHIDCLYVHSQHQRQGIAAALFAYASKVAIQHGHTTLSVDASIVAKPFFEQRGFVQTAENSVERNGQYLTNFSMTGPAIPQQSR